MVQAASEMFTRPVVPFEVKEWTVNQKRVLEIIVPAIRDILHSTPEKKDDCDVCHSYRCVRDFYQHF